MVRFKQQFPQQYVKAAKAQYSSPCSRSRGGDPQLISNANKKRLQMKAKNKMTNKPMKKHRYRPGTVALREIRR